MLIRTVDTDVVVLAVANFLKLGAETLWVAFGVGSNFRYLAVHEIVNVLGIERCSILPGFHALTGCDTVSAFFGRGKKTAWDAWTAFPEVNKALKEMNTLEKFEDLSQVSLSLVERFVVLIYDKTSTMFSVNQARKELFCRKQRSISNLPPTSAALHQHIKRSCLQLFVWNQCLTLNPSVRPPDEWGWKHVSDGWEPHWSILPEASKSCRELIRCGCQSGCVHNCKCAKAGLPCTLLCFCCGDC